MHTHTHTHTRTCRHLTEDVLMYTYTVTTHTHTRKHAPHILGKTPYLSFPLLLLLWFPSSLAFLFLFVLHTLPTT